MYLRLLSFAHLRPGKVNLCGSVEPRDFRRHQRESNRLSFMSVCYKLGTAAFEPTSWYF